MWIGDDHDGGEMVGRDDVGIGNDVRVLVCQFRPPSFDHPSGVASLHFPVHYLAEHTFPPLRHDGHIVPAGLRVIVASQANGTAAVCWGCRSCAHPRKPGFRTAWPHIYLFSARHTGASLAAQRTLRLNARRCALETECHHPSCSTPPWAGSVWKSGQERSAVHFPAAQHQ